MRNLIIDREFTFMASLTNKNNWINNNGYYLIIKENTEGIKEKIYKKMEDEQESFNKGDYIYKFPINPENLSIKTPIATILTPTLTSVVEECSGIIFYDISITGNTGVINNPNNDLNIRTTKNLDPKISKEKTSQLLRGFASGTEAVIKRMSKNAQKAITDLIGVNETELDNAISSISSTSFNGFTKFHELETMIVLYYSLKKQKKITSNLYFLSAKDNTIYQVAISNFDLVRNKINPLLYTYSITMRGFLSEETKIESNENQKIMKGLLEGISPKSMFYNTYLSAKDLLRDLTISLPSAIVNDINII